MSAADLPLGVAATGALVLPGWLVARRLRLPAPLLAGFIGGTLLLFGLVLAGDAAHVALAPRHLGLAWIAVIALAVAATWRHGAAAGAGQISRATPAAREAWPLFAALVPVLAAVAYRTTTQPLFGVDTVFRWNYLAEEMLARGSLGFYPPVTAADYAIYAWPDGIAPVVSSLYCWTYTVAGAAHAVATAPLIWLQVALLAAGIYALARRHFSPRAGAFAVALAAGSPVLWWAAAMGQETGLTALALLGLLLYLPESHETETTGAVVCAALAASLGALAREYGLVLPVFGLALAGLRRLSARRCGLFALVALGATAPWYLRNAALTGNPLFNLDVGGWFAVNPVHHWLNASYLAELGWDHLPAEAPRLLAVHGGLALLGAGAGLTFCFSPAWPLAAAAALFGGLWFASLGYTAAGFMYALRVLSPALAVAAVLGGAALARLVPGRRATGVIALALGLAATDAALRNLALPANVYRLPPHEWLTAGRALHDYHARPVYADLARVAGRERLLVLGPNALLTRAGARTLPLWSPEVRYLFDPTLPPAEIARRLRAADIGYVLLNTGKVNERFLARSAFFRDPAGTLPRVWFDADMVLLRVTPPAAR
jgi:hypothetical protein